MEKDSLKSILAAKETPSLSSSFDDEVMRTIFQAAEAKKMEKSYVVKMHLFFIIGVVLGAILAVTAFDIEFVIQDRLFSPHRIVFQVPLMIVVVFLFERVYRATLYEKRKKSGSTTTML